MKQCRICYGEDDPDDLICPCLCKGSQKYVHTECLNSWRQQSELSYYQCPTCQYKYRIQRVQWAKWIMNKYTLIACTVLTIALVVLIVTLFFQWLLYLLGSSLVTNAWQISRQITTYAFLAVGFAALLFLEVDRNQFRFNIFDLVYYQNTMYMMSIAGMVSLFTFTYRYVQSYAMLLLNQLGERILSVD